MKKQVFMRWFWCLLEYLMVFPVLLILAASMLPNDVAVPFTFILPLHTLASISIISAFKKIRNLLIAVISVAYIGGVVWLWQYTSMSGAIEELIVTIAATSLFFFWGIRTGIGASVREVFLYTAGLFVHAAGLFVLSHAPALKQFTGVAVGVAIVYVITGLPLANRRFLIFETRQKSSLSIIPGSVMRGNKIIVFSIIAGIVLLSFWKTLLDAVVSAAKAIAGLIKKIIDLFASLYQITEGQPEGGGGQMELPPAGQSNPVVQLILNLLAVLLSLTFLFFAIRYLVKNFRRICSVLYQYLSGIFSRFQKWSTTEQGYVDRQESLLKTEIPKRPSIFRRLFKREPGWRDMKDNASRVRFLYTRFVLDHIRKGFRFNPAETPDETVQRITEAGREKGPAHFQMLDAYRQVRYGKKEVDDGTVESLKDSYL